MGKITEGRTSHSNLALNFFVYFSIVAYNGAKIGEKGNDFQDFSLNINSESNSLGGLQIGWLTREFVIDPLHILKDVVYNCVIVCKEQFMNNFHNRQIIAGWKTH